MQIYFTVLVHITVVRQTFLVTYKRRRSQSAAGWFRCLNIIFPINHSPFVARCIYGTLSLLFKIQVGSSGRHIDSTDLVARPVSFIPLNSISFPVRFSFHVALILVS